MKERYLLGVEKNQEDFVIRRYGKKGAANFKKYLNFTVLFFRNKFAPSLNKGPWRDKPKFFLIALRFRSLLASVAREAKKIFRFRASEPTKGSIPPASVPGEWSPRLRPRGLKPLFFLLAIIALLVFNVVGYSPNKGKVAGTTNNWNVEPENQLGTATINHVQSNGTNGVELERYFNKTLSDTRIPYDHSNHRQNSPRATLTVDNYQYVVFLDHSADKVMMQKLDSNGIRQWEADREVFVSNCVNPTFAFDNETAIAEYGTDVVVAANCYSGAGVSNYIYAQRVNSEGVPQWPSDVRVHDNIANNHYAQEVVTIGSNIFIAWVDDRNIPNTYEIFAQTLDSSGNRTIPGDQALVIPGITLAGPYLNKTSSNKLLLTYANTSNRNMYGQQYDTSWTQEWGPNQIGLLNATPSVIKSQIATTVIGDTSFHFFRANYAVNFRVWAQSLDSLGNKRWNAGADLRVGFRVLPEALSAWNDGTNPYFAATEFDAAGFPCGKRVDAATGAVLWGSVNTKEPPLIAGSVTAPHQTSMSFVYTNSFNYIYFSNLNGIYWEDIFLNRFDASGTVNYPADRVVNQDFETANQQEVYLTEDGGGNIFAVWIDNRVAPLSDNVYAQLFDSSGNRLWTNDTLVNTSPTGPNYWHPKAVVAGTDYYVTWEINGNIYMNKLNAAGVRQWGDVNVNQGGASVAYNPSIAYDGANLVVVWDDNRALTGNNDIYFNAVNTAGVVQLAADQKVNVDVTASAQLEPEIRSDGVNTYVVWQDNQNSRPDIYMQRVNGVGVPQYPSDVMINENVSGGRYNPDFALDSGNLYIVWEDTRNKVSPNADIYLAGYSGAVRIFNDTQVNQTEAQRKILPHVGVSSGHLYIVWEDYRNSVTDHDIYVTSFTTGGIKRYLGDMRVTTNTGVLAENPAITLTDRYIGWDSDLDGSTNFNTYFSYSSDIHEASGNMSGNGLILDVGTPNVRFQTISWSATVPVNTAVRFRTRTADSLANLATAAWSAYYTVSGSAITSSDLQFMEVWLEMSTTNTAITSTIDNFTINYLTNEHPVISGIVVSSTANRQVQFQYTLTDVDDPTAVMSFEYWYNGAWHPSINVTNMGLKAVGATYYSVWNSSLDVPPTETVTTQIKLTGDDQYSFNNIGTGLSPQFILAYSPPGPSPTITGQPPSPSPSPSPSFSPSPSGIRRPICIGPDCEPPSPWDRIKEFCYEITHDRYIPLLALITFFILITTFWRYNPYFFLAKRRQKRKWGVVFDGASKEPIPKSQVEIYSADRKEIKQRIACNENGEFDLLLPAGRYYLKVNSKYVQNIKSGPFGGGTSYTTGREDLFYKNLYYDGEIIDTAAISQETQELQVSIPIIATAEFTKARSSRRIVNDIWAGIELLRLPLLIIGTFLALILLITRGGVFDWIILFLYLAIWVWDIFLLLATETAVVYVYDTSTNKPADLAVLRLINFSTKAIIAVETTDKNGQVVFKAVENGVYKIQAAKPGYELYLSRPESIKTLKSMGKIRMGLTPKSSSNNTTFVVK